MATRRRDYLYITEWLEYRGLSDQDVADKLGVKRETVWRWQVEQHRLNPQKILQLADLLGISPAELWNPPAAPNRRSVNLILKEAPDDIYETVADIAERLLKSKPTS